MRKAASSNADAVVFDLEDAVAPEDKASARARVAELVGPGDASPAARIHVRVNSCTSGQGAEDVDAVVRPGLEALRLPKCESDRDVVVVDELVGRLERQRGLPTGSVWLYPTVESARGIRAIDQIAGSSPRVAALVFGPADFSASLGVPELPHEATIVARSLLVIGSAAAGIGRPVDGAYRDVGDLDALRAACEQARDLGFSGKSAIHPRQVPVIRDVFSPTERDIAWAARVLSSSSDGHVAAVLDGTFVDPAIMKQARATLDLAARIHGEEYRRA